MTQIYQLLIDKLTAKSSSIDSWLKDQFLKNKPLFYNSVDLRHSAFKIAPIDTNCFPAGFNNLSQNSRKIAAELAATFLKNNFPTAKKILIIPENHTRNFRYLENVLVLSDIISKSAETLIGSLIPEIETTLEIDLENGQKIALQKIVKNGDKISTKSGFVPDLIISNNDFTGGVDELLQNIAQPIVPSTSLGWYQRTKSKHFENYNQIAAEFSALIDIDPWLISTMHGDCDEVDFKEMVGLECLATGVDKMLADLGAKYSKYGVDSKPYCYIKADNGTYGLAMMTVDSSAEILELNKKERNKMNVIKGSVQNTKVIIQEGVTTIDKIKNVVAEPMIYLINGEVAGNLFRANDARDENISLNAAGMSFYDLNNLSEDQLLLGSSRENIIKIYSLISRLAALAAAREQY
jgi:glutamate--cysteine ligase